MRVLIISYYFPPSNGAPAWRPFSWAETFAGKDVSTFVITRQWTGSESTWDDVLAGNRKPTTIKQFNGYSVAYLPTVRFNAYDLLHRKGKIISFFRNIYYFILATLGRFNTEIDGFLTFKDYLKEHLKVVNYDAVIITSPPSNLLRLTTLIKKYSTAQIIADFRDLWNNDLLSQDYNPAIKQKTWDFLYAFYYRKWLKNCDHVTVVVPSFNEVLQKLYKGPITTVYNGFEDQHFAMLKRNDFAVFRFAVIGSIYPPQQLEIMLKGLNLFMHGKPTAQISLRFIGLDAIPEVRKKIEDSLAGYNLFITGRVSKQEAIQETIDADVLSYPGWRGYKGIISTKIFDYLASGNRILIGPGDGDIIDSLVQKYNAGKVVNSPEEFAASLDLWYSEWLINGNLSPLSHTQSFVEYSRENQALNMLKIISDEADARNLHQKMKGS